MDDMSIFSFSICAILFNSINMAPVMAQDIWGLQYRAAIYLKKNSEKARQKQPEAKKMRINHQRTALGSDHNYALVKRAKMNSLLLLTWLPP